MLEPAASYRDLIACFRWSIPARFNIGVACADIFAAREPDRPALLRYDDDGDLTATSYGDLKRASDALAHALRQRGIVRGDRVALLLPQAVETVVGHLAAYKLGAIAVPLAALFGEDALRYRLQASGAKAILTDDAGLAKLARIRSSCPVPGTVLSIDGPARRRRRLPSSHRAASDAFRRRRVDARRPGADDLHLRHDRPAEGRAPRPPRPPRPPPRLRLHPRIRAPARRPPVDAIRLGLGRRSPQRASFRPLSRHPRRLRTVPAVRSRGRLRSDERRRRAQCLPAADGDQAAARGRATRAAASI